jgi:hypothetical protein
MPPGHAIAVLLRMPVRLWLQRESQGSDAGKFDMYIPNSPRMPKINQTCPHCGPI